MIKINSRIVLSVILWLGDIVTFGIVTIIGFSSHGELADAGSRMFSTFIPLVIAWIIAAWPIKVLEIDTALQLSQIWKPVWSICLAVPLAALLRACILSFRPIPPIFVLVLILVGITAILIWRILFYFVFKESIPK